MSSILTELSGASVGAIETAIGFALGFAASDALGPLATTIRQEVYSADPSRALDPADAARIVAQALQTLGWGENEAAASGVNSGKFDLLAASELTAPAPGMLIQLLRRKQLGADDFTYALRKAQLDSRYDGLIRGLTATALEGAELANAIHRGNMASEGLLLVPAPTTPGSIPQYPVSPLDPVEQAAWHGISKDQLAVLVGNAGLPLALHEMLGLLNRGIVTSDDVKRAIAHSNIRNEYMDVAIDLRRRLLTPHEYAELQLRGYLTKAQRNAGAALSGMEPDDTELLYNVLGRSIPVHQITTGQARGGTYNGSHDAIPAEYLSSLERGNLRPEYYNLAYANRYTYPSAFVLRAIVQAGELTQDEGHQALLDIGWEPTLARKVAAAWTGTGGATVDKHEAKAETQVWTALHRSYVDNLSTDAEAETDLAALGVTAASVPKVLSLWQRERAIVRRSLSPAQLKKAAAEKLITAQEATARLLSLGYSAEDAATLLAE